MGLVDVYEEIVRLRQEGRRGALATIVNVRGSIPSFETAKMLVRDDGSIVGTIGGGCVEAEVWQAAKDVMASEKPRTLKFDLNNDPKYDTGLVCGGTLEVFVEPVAPAPHLYLFGAGHVAHSLYKVARLAGFDVTVTDDRESYASRERFPEARDVYAEHREHHEPEVAGLVEEAELEVHAHHPGEDDRGQQHCREDGERLHDVVRSLAQPAEVDIG